jgi:chromosome partitioning protein
MTLKAAVFLDKGGTGKTTTTAHLGRALTGLGHKGVLIDLAGKQSDLAKQFGLYDEQQQAIENDEDFPNLSTVFDDDFDKLVKMNGAEAILDRLIYETDEGVDLIPAHPGLDSVDGELNNIEDREERYGRLKKFVNEYLEDRYDFILIDLPGLSRIVPYNGVWAAENLIAPVEMGSYEFAQAKQLADDVDKYRSNWGIDAELSMVIPNKFERGTNLADDYMERYTAEFNGAMSPEPIAKSQDIRNATEAGKTIFALEEPSTTAQRARDAYLANARALVDRLGGVDA